MTDYKRATSGTNNSVLYSDDNGRLTIRTEGSRAWRNNNPGNIRDGDFAKKHGAIGEAGGFAVFPNETAGRKALSDLLNTKPYQSLTVGEAIKRYAPPNENNTVQYIRNIEILSGVKATKPIRNISFAEKERMIDTIKRIEGWQAGKTEQDVVSQSFSYKEIELWGRPVQEIEEGEIQKIIGSPSYQNPNHPSYILTRKKVSEWYAYHYHNDPVETDATGRMVQPSERPSASENVHVRAHDRKAGKIHVHAYDRKKQEK